MGLVDSRNLCVLCKAPPIQDHENYFTVHIIQLHGNTSYFRAKVPDNKAVFVQQGLMTPTIMLLYLQYRERNQIITYFGIILAV
jgi:hypothetical protein